MSCLHELSSRHAACLKRDYLTQRQDILPSLLITTLEESLRILRNHPQGAGRQKCQPDSRA